MITLIIIIYTYSYSERIQRYTLIKMRKIALLSTILIVLISCSNKESAEKEQTPIVSVKVASVMSGAIENDISLNGKTIYLKKNLVVAPISGYVQKMHVKFGDYVKKNTLLFEIQTKENKALESSEANKMGIINVYSPSNGVISTLSIAETGAYVVEGVALCTVADNNDVLVQLNLPFEYNSLISTGTRCTLVLGEDTRFEGTVYQILPTVDEANQTQQVLIKPHTNRKLPENLNLEVRILKSKHNRACIVPRSAVMANETQTEFWVMKVVNNKLAIKVPIQKGIENDDKVEALSSTLTKSDVVVCEGGYGLNDSTVVKVGR